MAEDRVLCGECNHCSVVVAPDGAAMYCKYRGRIGYFLPKECEHYDPKEGDDKYKNGT